MTVNLNNHTFSPGRLLLWKCMAHCKFYIARTRTIKKNLKHQSDFLFVFVIVYWLVGMMQYFAQV